MFCMSLESLESSISSSLLVEGQVSRPAMIAA